MSAAPDSPDSNEGSTSAAEGARERRGLTIAAVVVAAGTLASRALGLGRELVLAAHFDRLATDAFFVAFTIPNVLRQLLAEGAVQNAVLPVLTEVRQRDGEAAARLYFSAIRGVSLLVLLLVTLAGVLGAEPLVLLFAGGFADRPEQFARTVSLTRAMFPYIFFMGTTALGVAALNSRREFLVTSFAPALLNVAMIGCALVLPAPLLAAGVDPVHALSIGALVGGVLQMIAQWPALRAAGYLVLPRLALREPAVQETLRRLGPVLFGIGVYQLDVMLARRFLSDLPVGAQSYFMYALRLCDFPQGIFVMALQAATLPSLSRLAAAGDRRELATTLAYGLRLAMFVAVPATVAAVVLAEPLVIALLQRGAFDAEASRQTAAALIAQGAGIWLVAVVRQLVAGFYALGDTRTPVVVSTIDLGAFIALALLLRGPLGHAGVGAAVTGATLVQAALLAWWLRARMPELPLRELAVSVVRCFAAASGAGAVGWAMSWWLGGALHGGALARLVPAVVALTAFGVSYVAFSVLLRSPELGALRAPLGARLSRVWRRR